MIEVTFFLQNCDKELAGKGFPSTVVSLIFPVIFLKQVLNAMQNPLQAYKSRSKHRQRLLSINDVKIHSSKERGQESSLASSVYVRPELSNRATVAHFE